jgi:glucosamine-6-phosphate deaminase
MDEYVGISDKHPASFRLWLKTRVAEVVHPASMHYLGGDAADIDAELKRYAGLLAAAPIDLAFVGFGENGHIAFNDPHEADFNDPKVIKIVTLDEACRKQQVGEGHFPSMADCPSKAITLTCPTLLSAEHLVCCVPDARKSNAVRGALEGPISTDCPASIVRTHAHASIYLDGPSASLLNKSGSAR